MRSSVLRLNTLLFAALAVAGCSGDDSATSAGSTTDSSSTTADTTSSTSSSTTTTSTTSETTGSGSDTGTTTSSTSETTTSTSSTTDATDSSTTAATDSTTGSTTDATTTGGLQCEVDPNADACQMCMAANCCDEITACADDEDCTCFTNCIGEGTPPQQCVQMCMVNPMQNQALQDLRTCNLDNCADECG